MPSSQKRCSCASLSAWPCTMLTVVAEQAGGFELLPAVGRARRTAALVQRGDEAELLGHAEVVQRHVAASNNAARARRRARSAAAGPGALCSRRSTSARGCGTSQNGRLARLRVGLRRAVEERGADAGFQQARRWPRRCAAASRLLWHQSTSVVVPQLSWFSAPTRVAMYRSSGVEHGGQARRASSGSTRAASSWRPGRAARSARCACAH